MATQRWLKFLVVVGLLIAGIARPMSVTHAAVLNPPHDPMLPLQGEWGGNSSPTSVPRMNISGTQAVATASHSYCYKVGSSSLAYRNIAFKGPTYFTTYARYYIQYTAQRWWYGSSGNYGDPSCGSPRDGVYWKTTNLYLSLDGTELMEYGPNIHGDGMMYLYWYRVNPETTLTHNVAYAMVRNAGLDVQGSNYVGPDQRSDGTSFTNIRRNTIAGIINFRFRSGCAVRITGGTESGHSSGTYSHGTGYKVDISPTTCVNGVILSYPTCTANCYTSYTSYKGPEGAIYADERNNPNGAHWDILYF